MTQNKCDVNFSFFFFYLSTKCFPAGKGNAVSVPVAQERRTERAILVSAVISTHPRSRSSKSAKLAMLHSRSEKYHVVA